MTITRKTTFFAYLKVGNAYYRHPYVYQLRLEAPCLIKHVSLSHHPVNDQLSAWLIRNNSGRKAACSFQANKHSLVLSKCQVLGYYPPTTGLFTCGKAPRRHLRRCKQCESWASFMLAQCLSLLYRSIAYIYGWGKEGRHSPYCVDPLVSSDRKGQLISGLKGHC